MRNAQLAKPATRRNETRLDAPLTVTLPPNLSATVRYIAHLKGITPEEEVCDALSQIDDDFPGLVIRDPERARDWLLGKEEAS